MSDEKENPNEEKQAPNQAPELSDKEMDNVTGGAVNAYLIIDGRPGPSTSKNNSIDILSETPGSDS